MSLVEKRSDFADRPRLYRDANPGIEFSLPRGFEPIELAGMGTFSEVWKAMEGSTGRICALKRLRPERADDPTGRQLMANESQASQVVKSQYLPKLHRAELRADVPYLVFEWLEGSTLEDECCDIGPLPLARALWIARQCADGMLDLERAGFAHGDIKPQNIFITLGGEVKLLDLGFVRPIHPPVGPSDGDSLTGTPEFLAPEALVHGVAQPIARDMYSLGITLYRMLTGRLPFVGETAALVMARHRQTRPTLVRHFRADAPRQLSDLVGRLLAKQPLRRPQNLRSLIRELVDLELLVLTSQLAEGAQSG